MDLAQSALTMLVLVVEDLVLDLQTMEEEKVKGNQVQVVQDLVLDLLVLGVKANQVQVVVALLMQA